MSHSTRRLFIVAAVLISLALLAAASWYMLVFRNKHTVQIADVTKPETIILRASPNQRDSYFFRISFRLRGHLDGEATIAAKSELGQKLTGTFDVKILADCYSDSYELQYSPTDAHSGEVIIEYEFLD